MAIKINIERNKDIKKRKIKYKATKTNGGIE